MSITEVLIFVVDDEVMILEALQDALQDAGYTVSSAAGGEDAMRLVQSAGHDFRALVTDVNLPGAITGWDVARRARQINPTLPVIYMTGASGHEWGALGVPESVLLSKPFALAQVVTAVSQLLTASSSALPASIERSPQAHPDAPETGGMTAAAGGVGVGSS